MVHTEVRRGRGQGGKGRWSGFILQDETGAGVQEEVGTDNGLVETGVVVPVLDWQCARSKKTYRINVQQLMWFNNMSQWLQFVNINQQMYDPKINNI